MYTQCPHCRTIFRVHAQQLRAAHGWVRCCRCDEVFDGLDRLQEETEVPANVDPSTKAHTAKLIEDPGPEDSDRTPPLPLPFDVPPDLPALPEAAEHGQPPDLPNPEPAQTTRFWNIGVLLLTLLLLGQFAWWERDRLAQHPTGRFLLAQLCRNLPAICDLLIEKDPEQIQILSRNVTVHPDIEGALMVKLVIANQAPFPQPYPLLQIDLFDRLQRQIAQRRFTPSEYQVRQERSTKHMAPGESALLELELADPGSSVTGYRFDFF